MIRTISKREYIKTFKKNQTFFKINKIPLFLKTKNIYKYQKKKMNDLKFKENNFFSLYCAGMFILLLMLISLYIYTLSICAGYSQF
jgi:hypothetical protein